MQRRRGFTLVELVIVIAVIGILATVLVPTFGTIIDKANKSTDVQTAGNLTTLIAMYGVEHPIESEADIAAAINEGKGDDTFYQNLKAKSAKQGYCFWYEISTGKVIVEKLEDLNPTESPTAGTPGDAGRTGTGLRDSIVDGYILLGGGNNDLLNLVVELENATAETYSTILDKIESSGFDGLKEAAKTTAIHNDSGLVAYNNAVTAVHIPQTAEKLLNSVYVADGTDLSLSGITVVIPKGTIVGGGSLYYLDDTCTVRVLVSAEELPNTIEMQSVIAPIFVSNGDGYLQDVTRYDANIFNPISNGTTISGEVDDSAKLGSFVLSDNDNEYLYIDTSAQIIYVSKDLTDAFNLVADSFTAVGDGTPVSGFMTWKLNGSETPLTNKGKTISITPDVTKVEVSTMGVEYTYTVKPVMVDRFEVLRFGGIDYGRNLGYGTQDNNTVIGTWGLEVDIHMTAGLTLDQIKVDQTISIVEDYSSDLFKLIGVDDKHNATLSIFTTEGDKEVLKISGDQYKKPIKFVCGLHGFETDEMEISLIDSSKSAFKIIDDVNTQTKYNFPFVVGTQGHVITLKDLFDVKDGVQVTGHVMVSTNGGNTWKEYTAKQWGDGIALNDFVNDANSEGILNLTIKVEGGNYDKDEEKNSIPLVLKVVSGAWNVATLDEWKNVPKDDKSIVKHDIVLLEDLEIPAKPDDADYYTEATAGGYAKNIGGKDIYGNLHTIYVPDGFRIVLGAYNYFINATAGANIDRLIIDGPEYGKVVSVTGSAGDADNKDKGTFTSAIKVSGGTEANPVVITNCFLSGFRSPVHAENGRVEISKSTLHLGNYANLYIDGKVDLKLTNVTTVQYTANKDTENANIGGGISYKHDAGTGQTITATNLTQYNFLTREEMDMLIGQAGGIVESASDRINLPFGIKIDKLLSAIADGALKIDEKNDLPKLSGVSHEFTDKDGKNKTYYHMGITALEIPLLNDADTVPASFGEGNNNKPDVKYGSGDSEKKVSDISTVNKEIRFIFTVKIANLHVWGLPNGAAAKLPPTNLADNVYEFLTVTQGIGADVANTYVAKLK